MPGRISEQYAMTGGISEQYTHPTGGISGDTPG